MDDEFVEQLKTLCTKLPKDAAKVVAEYSGSGDSGDFDTLAVTDAKGKAVILDDGLESRLFDAFGDILFSHRRGWENHDGGSGTFTLNVAARKLRHEHLDYYTQATTTVKTIKIKD